MDNTTTTVHPPLKQGDWCFYEFTLCVVEECDADGRILSLADGYFVRGGPDMRDECLPLTKLNKLLSEQFTSLSNRIHAINAGKLNYPDLHSYLVRKWRDCCDLVHTMEEREAIKAQAGAFVARVEQLCNGFRDVVIDGVRIFN